MMHIKIRFLGSVFILLLLLGCGLFPAEESSSTTGSSSNSSDDSSDNSSDNSSDFTGTKQWSTLLGGASTDVGNEVSIDSSGNVYVTGYSEGNFDGHTSSGAGDMFLVKYNSSGEKQWSVLLGSSANDVGYGVAVDASGNAYVTGYSSGNFDGQSNSGSTDMLLVKYNSSGEKQWSVLLGSSANDVGYGAAVDASGNVYVTGISQGTFDGHTYKGGTDLFLVKYNSSGEKQWSVLIGTWNSTDFAEDVSVDSSGNVYVVGYTSGNFDSQTNSGSTDMLLVKYNSSGEKQWSTLLGSSTADYGYGAALDSSGNIYVSGYTHGNFDDHTNAGGLDTFVVKYDSSGAKQWSALLGTSSTDWGRGLSVDRSGNVYVTGHSEGNLDGHTNSGSRDLFLVQYNTTGTKQWSTLLGTSSSDVGYESSVDRSGNVYVTGYSSGNLDGHSNSGSADMSLVKYK